MDNVRTIWRPRTVASQFSRKHSFRVVASRRMSHNWPFYSPFHNLNCHREFSAPASSWCNSHIGWISCHYQLSTQDIKTYMWTASDQSKQFNTRPDLEAGHWQIPWVKSWQLQVLATRWKWRWPSLDWSHRPPVEPTGVTASTQVLKSQGFEAHLLLLCTFVRSGFSSLLLLASLTLSLSKGNASVTWVCVEKPKPAPECFGFPAHIYHPMIGDQIPALLLAGESRLPRRAKQIPVLADVGQTPRVIGSNRKCSPDMRSRPGERLCLE